MPYCCENCFADAWLKEQVRGMSEHWGTCDYCKVDDEEGGEEPVEVAILEVEQLSGYFHRLLTMYSIPEYDAFETGEMLIYRIQEDWDVFDEDHLNQDTQATLLEDIVNSDWDDDDGESPIDAHELYIVGGQHHVSNADIWSEFVDEVRKNPDRDIPLDYELDESLVRAEKVIVAGTRFYRARLGCEHGQYGRRIPYSNNTIGAPPAQLVTKPARANRRNEPVLYCADDEVTAVAETRPARGYLVSACTLTLNRDARILDLCAPFKAVNPFITDTPLWECELNELLHEFATEMSLPLERLDDEETHYLPTQKLAEHIKKRGFDGIRYPSALNGDGTNIVFFDPAIATIGDSKLLRIRETRVEFEKYRE
jgi:RES domain-containing protein